MKSEVLNEWAAKFLGEDELEIGDAVASEWYTTSPGAAFVVLNKAAAEGKNVKVEIEDGMVEVYCGEAKKEGSIRDLAKLIVEACYECIGK